MNKVSRKSCKGISFIPLIQGLFIFTLILITISCTQKQKPYSIVEFRGDEMVTNYTKNFIQNDYKADSSFQNAFLAEKGDLFTTSNNGVYLFREDSPRKFTVKTTGKACYFNDKIVSITIPGNDSLIPWIEQLKEPEISELGYVSLNSKFRESYIPCLTGLSKLKPGIGIGYDREIKDIDSLIKIFRPRILTTGSISADDFKDLSALQEVEILSVILEDSTIVNPLPELPHLRTLILTDTRGDKPALNLLENNKQIENLVIMYSGIIDLTLLSPLVNLKELVIGGTDTIVNAELIKNHKNLEVFIQNGSKFSYDQNLAELGKIRWINFSNADTQDDITNFIKKHPALEVVDINWNKKINSLQPLLDLKKIYGLTITDTLTDFNTLKSLKTLTFLSLPVSILNDSIKKAELRKELPGTLLVANHHGACLGSGWILLLVPLILLFCLISSYKIRKSRTI
jgi:hypothetical protein